MPAIRSAIPSVELEVRIDGHGAVDRVYVNGKGVRGVVKASIENEVNAPPLLHLTFSRWEATQ